MRIVHCTGSEAADEDQCNGDSDGSLSDSNGARGGKPPAKRAKVSPYDMLTGMCVQHQAPMRTGSARTCSVTLSTIHLIKSMPLLLGHRPAQGRRTRTSSLTYDNNSRCFVHVYQFWVLSRYGTSICRSPEGLYISHDIYKYLINQKYIFEQTQVSYLCFLRLL